MGEKQAFEAETDRVMEDISPPLSVGDACNRNCKVIEDVNFLYRVLHLVVQCNAHATGQKLGEECLTS